MCISKQTYASTECLGVSFTINSAQRQVPVYGKTPDGNIRK
jgi:hypothetical protein